MDNHRRQQQSLEQQPIRQRQQWRHQEGQHLKNMMNYFLGEVKNFYNNNLEMNFLQPAVVLLWFILLRPLLRPLQSPEQHRGLAVWDSHFMNLKSSNHSSDFPLVFLSFYSLFGNWQDFIVLLVCRWHQQQLCKFQWNLWEQKHQQQLRKFL